MKTSTDVPTIPHTIMKHKTELFYEFIYIQRGIKPVYYSDLYPNSSWIYLKNNCSDTYNKFNFYNKVLTIHQISEINLYLNQIVEKLFKK